MPVLGHAFVGLATAVSMPPSKSASAGSALWTPTIVGLAYLPDITAQIMLLAGLKAWLPACHSMLLAPAAAAVVAFLLVRLSPVTFPRAFTITLLCIVLHDSMDLLQGTDRMLWWPVSDRLVRFGEGIFPVGVYHEVLLFGALFGVFLGCRRFWQRRRSGEKGRQAARSAPGFRFLWFGRAVTALILLCAAGTHYLRGVREHQLEHARTLLTRGEYSQTLTALDEADHWPSAAKPGRIDYARAEAYLGLGDRARAEQHYLRSIEVDPSYFWCVADLAVFYAASDEPIEARRLRTAQYIKRLRSDFPDHVALPRFLAKIERKLSAPVIHSTMAPAG